MNGHRALVYARVRKNELNPAENDFSRAERQQQVVQAISDKTVGFWGYLHMPLSRGVSSSRSRPTSQPGSSFSSDG